MRWIATTAVWCYVGAIAAVLALLYAIGDRWWPSTFLLFGPRWLLALPLLGLVPAALATRRRLLWPLLLTVVLLIGPIMGFCIPWGRISIPTGHPLRVLTCNLSVDSTAAESIGSLAREFRPDVIAFQEVRSSSRFEWLAGWNVIRERELLVASRYPLHETHHDLRLHPPHRWPRVSLLHCVVETPFGDVNFCNVHLPSPRFGISEVLDRSTVINPSRRATLVEETQNRQEVSRRAAQWIGQLEGPVLVVGDFNMPKESTIYRHDWSEYVDAFSQSGLGLGWTEWPAIRGVPYGIRIDHILMGAGWHSSRAWVGPDVGSDHLPLLATLLRIR
jgi:endonuclease/exonuclease/phosphatase (EEP) superfamily protein YafD